MNDVEEIQGILDDGEREVLLELATKHGGQVSYKRNPDGSVTPYELNLGWLVDFRKPHFNGRLALLKERDRGPRYTLTKLDIEGNKPAENSIQLG